MDVQLYNWAIVQLCNCAIVQLCLAQCLFLNFHCRSCRLKEAREKLNVKESYQRDQPGCPDGSCPRWGGAPPSHPPSSPPSASQLCFCSFTAQVPRFLSVQASKHLVTPNHTQIPPSTENHMSQRQSHAWDVDRSSAEAGLSHFGVSCWYADYSLVSNKTLAGEILKLLLDMTSCPCILGQS